MYYLGYMYDISIASAIKLGLLALDRLLTRASIYQSLSINLSKGINQFIYYPNIIIIAYMYE